MTHISDDYASLEVGNLKFYYGYEVTMCATHGPDADCECSEWCFTVTRSGEEQMRIPKKELNAPAWDMAKKLLEGIAIWMSRQGTNNL